MESQPARGWREEKTFSPFIHITQIGVKLFFELGHLKKKFIHVSFQHLRKLVYYFFLNLVFILKQWFVVIEFFFVLIQVFISRVLLLLLLLLSTWKDT